MQHSGVIAGPAGGSSGIVAAASAAHRDARTEALAAAGPAKRAGRHDTAAFIRATDKAEDAVAVIARRHGFDRPDRRHGAPSSAYMAQHIAQEVTPERPGADSHQAGARAYVMRRDSTVEILTSAGRLDIFV